jgi:GNAT superfamily N-acetyltransferase
LIRLADESEIETIRALERDAAKRFSAEGFSDLESHEPWPSDAVRDHVLAGCAWLSLDGHDAPCGFVLAWAIDDMAIVCELGVARSHSRKGHGRGLVEMVIEWARMRGIPVVGLGAYRDVPWNRPFYESLGFRVVDETDHVRWMTRQLERERTESPTLAAQRVFMVRAVR